MNRESQMAHGIVGKYKVQSGINVHVAFRILCTVNEISCSSLFFYKALILGTFRGKKVVICHPEG